MAMYRLADDMPANDTQATSKDDLDQLLAGLPAAALGNRFLVICRLGLVEPLLAAVTDHALFHMDSQWVFMVTDTVGGDMGAANMTPYLQTAQEYIYIYIYGI